jgi:TetR/AcrR family transcriptional regulator
MPAIERIQHPVSFAARRQATRAAILAAAARIFAKKGLAGARTDSIAAAAGVNKAMLYYYFKSKDGLYEAVVEDQFAEFNCEAIQVLSAPGSARAALLRYVDLHVDFISQRNQSAPLFQQMAMTGHKFLKRIVRRYFAARGKALGNVITRGIRQGEFRQVDPFQTSVSIIALIVFYFSSAPVLKLLGHADAYSAVNLGRRKREVVDFIRHGLFIDPAIDPTVQP